MPPNVERLMTVRCRPPIPGGRAATWAWHSFALRDRASNEQSIFPTSCSLSVLIPESAIITKSAGACGCTRQARIKRHDRLSTKYLRSPYGSRGRQATHHSPRWRAIPIGREHEAVHSTGSRATFMENGKHTITKIRQRDHHSLATRSVKKGKALFRP
jgi:hypothetical protein